MSINFSNYQYTVVKRFMEYVQIDTQSDASSNSQPSTLKQLDLSKKLVQELLEMGISDAHLDEYGYVYATIPSNSEKNVPTICFCSHVDTAPDCSGKNVKPILHSNYQGQEIVLPDDTTQILSLTNHPYLSQHIGNDVITASGLTLLGADDKGGVAEIMDAAHFLMTHPQIKHGTVKLLFTPDEEIGRGVVKVNIAKLGAKFGYTLDGGPIGTLEDETFSADAVKITINGVSAHPGYAKGSMENAIKIASEIVAALPKSRLSPESTENRGGFVHPTSISGELESATIGFIIRDFDTKMLQSHENELESIVKDIIKNYPNSTYQFDISEQYRNMKEVVEQFPEIIENAEEAVRRIGLVPEKSLIRGGTDGSRLSFMGLPCPNLFVGMMGIHSKQEWIGVRDMKKAVEMIVNICNIFEERA